MRKTGFIKVIVLVFFLGGCSLFHPYKSQFSCPIIENGKCVSMTTAYKESKGEIGLPETGPTINVNTPPPDDHYREAFLNRMTTLIEAPSVPVVTQPQVARVLILPYEGENTFYSERYIYLLLNRSQWVLSTGNLAQPNEKE
jgi:conjugal transfer pilus assembly protein TraV